MGTLAPSSSVSTTELRVSLLGGFELRVSNSAVSVSRPAQRLLALLAVHRDRPLRRSLISERLWCDADPRHASASLRSTLWRLPRPHGRQLVASTRGLLRLGPQVAVDLWESESRARHLVSGGSRDGLGADAALLELFSQDLLPDWYDDWLLVEQETYRQMRLHALEGLSSALCAAERHPAALMAGLAAVAGEPLRESAHCCVIRAHLAEGNHAEALRQFQMYRRLLADELGLAPSAAIRRLVAPLLGRPVDAVTR